MIEQIQGRVIRKSPTFCVVDCHGIGVGIYISLNTYESLDSEQEIQLLTHLHVREDALQLFGFKTEKERNIFRQLIGVSGIGPRLAITILSGITVDELVEAIITENHLLLTKIPGVGKKTAQRVVIELKEKVSTAAGIAIGKDFPEIASRNGDKVNQAFLALVALGYKQPDARRALHKVFQSAPQDVSVEKLIKLALKEI